MKPHAPDFLQGRNEHHDPELDRDCLCKIFGVLAMVASATCMVMAVVSALRSWL